MCDAMLPPAQETRRWRRSLTPAHEPARQRIAPVPEPALRRRQRQRLPPPPERISIAAKNAADGHPSGRRPEIGGAGGELVAADLVTGDQHEQCVDVKWWSWAD